MQGLALAHDTLGLPELAIAGAIGLGSLLVNQFIDLARVNGLRHLSCMLLSDFEDDAIRVLKDLGFRAFDIPDYGADPDGGAHDMTSMVLKL